MKENNFELYFYFVVHLIFSFLLAVVEVLVMAADVVVVLFEIQITIALDYLYLNLMKMKNNNNYGKNSEVWHEKKMFFSQMHWGYPKIGRFWKKKKCDELEDENNFLYKENEFVVEENYILKNDINLNCWIARKCGT